MSIHDHPKANKTDAGNGSKAICRVSNVLRSPSPDPKRSAEISMSWFSRILPIRRPSRVVPSLQSLRLADRSCDVFGAGMHKYREVHVPLQRLDSLEDDCGFILPPGFRHHIATIGVGVGPYYGLFDLDEIRVWALYPKIFLPMLPFRFSGRDFLSIEGANEIPWTACDFPVHGCVPIGDQGCGHQSLLVVCGPDSGSIWDLVEGEIAPARRPPGFVMPPKVVLPSLPCPPTFTEWYRGWMEQAAADLNQ